MEPEGRSVLDTPLSRSITVFVRSAAATNPDSVIPDVQAHIVDAPLGAGPEYILPVVVMDSGLAIRAPRNDEFALHAPAHATTCLPSRAVT
jgi:hypothetical protein